MRALWRHARRATLAGSGWCEIERGAMVTHDERLIWVGNDAAFLAGQIARR